MHLAWGMLLLPAAALAQTLTATDFVKYYDYEGSLETAGTVTVTTDGTSQTLTYSLPTGTDVGCAAGAGSADNSCGVHIHSGMTCTDDAGGHWYDDETITEDPWASITYFVGSGTAGPVDTGLAASDLVGRALIIHDYSGGRIACALLTVTVDWDLGMDPQTLSVAAGTTVRFTWSSTHDVWEMSETAFDACNKTIGTEVASTEVQTIDVAAPDTPTTKYYICKVGSHCIMGQKIAITWEAASTAAPVFAPTLGPSAAATLAPTNSSDEPTQNIVEIALSMNETFSTLVGLLEGADLVETLSGPGPFTVFAPTNDAFAKIDAATLESLTAEQLTNILLYHVLSGQVLSTDLSVGLQPETLAESTINVTSLTPPTINGIAIIDPADVLATNGVVHVIDTVLMPPAPPTPAPVASAKNIVELAQATDSLSTLVDAVIAAELVDTLSGDGPFTVFAPTNDAFAALGSTLDDLLLPENKATLTSILKYHVVSGTVLSTDLTETDVPTLEGDTVKVTLGDTVMINNATVITPDVLASNGVVHVIDSVLIPPAAPTPTPAPISGEFSGPAPTINPTPAPTAESVVINSQLVLAQVTVDAATLETIVKTALVATLTSVTSADQIVAFSVVSSRRRRLQQSTTKVTFSVRVAGSAEFATDYAETIVSDLSTAAQSGALNTALATAADAESAVEPTAPAAANDYDTIMAATAVDGAPTPQPVATTPAPSRRPTPAPSRRPTPQPVPQPTRRPTLRPTASTAGMEEEDGSEDQGEDESEDKGADSASGGLAVLGIALAAFICLLCVGGYVRMKMFGSQDRSDRDWARDLHGSGVSNPAAARDPWGRPTPSETRGVELASSHGLRSYH